jgi:SSS family solute:Na+ symporter
MSRPRPWILALCVVVCAASWAGDWPRHVDCYRGTTPVLDGVISPGEYADATVFCGMDYWTPQFTPVTDPKDLSLVGYVKHDGSRLYFAFDISDDILYGIDTNRWLPAGYPKAHELTREGFPWFGDEVEILINADNRWQPDDIAAGNGRSWQMVCNLTKSRLGGIGVGGLLEGEPRQSQTAWDTYQRWILTHAMDAVAKVKPEGHGYVIEWAVSFSPCLEVEPGVFYNASMGRRKMGLNIALGDIDQEYRGAGNFAGFHHEDWFAGEKDLRTLLREYGSLYMYPGPKPER